MFKKNRLTTFYIRYFTAVSSCTDPQKYFFVALRATRNLYLASLSDSLVYSSCGLMMSPGFCRARRDHLVLSRVCLAPTSFASVLCSALCVNCVNRVTQVSTLNRAFTQPMCSPVTWLCRVSGFLPSYPLNFHPVKLTSKHLRQM